MGVISKLGAVSLNCPDPHALALFYSALLEKEIAFESEDFTAIQLDNTQHKSLKWRQLTRDGSRNIQ